ncbi:MAG: hypothetical protein UHN02_07880 [Acutalibacteraceae bacterium]|nr:hypothetical protein [Acutalibacteraceae bacterium]
MKVSKRQDAIINIINSKEIETQEQLRTELNNLGFNVTQATVSRDIKKLKLTKSVNLYGVYCYKVFQQTESKQVVDNFIKSSIISINYSLNNIVIKLNPGMAQAGAARIDQRHIDGIIGTIAGDDTILLITRSEEDSKKIINEIDKLF